MIHVIIRTVRLRNIKSSKHPKLFRVPLNISFEKPLNPDHYLGMSFTTLFLILHSYFEIIVFIFEIKKNCFTDSYSYDSNYEANEQMYSLFREQILENDLKNEYILMYDYNTYGAGKGKYFFIKVSNTTNSITMFINQQLSYLYYYKVVGEKLLSKESFLFLVDKPSVG